MKKAVFKRISSISSLLILILITPPIFATALQIPHSFNTTNTASPTTLNWQALPGPDGGQVMDIAVSPDNPNLLYAAVYNVGIYKSTNGGKVWNLTTPLKTSSSPNLFVVQLVINQKALYVVANNGQDNLAQTYIFKSIDQGEHWVEVDNTLPKQVTFAYLVSTNNALYAETDQGLYMTNNRGQNWLPINTYLTQGMRGRSFLALGKTLYEGSQTSYGLIKSVNGGITWTTILPSLNILALLNVNGVIYAAYNDAMNNAGIMQSSNGGQNWSEADKGIYGCHISSLNAQGSTIFATAVSSYPPSSSPCTIGIYKSTNGGNSWISINNGLPYHVVNNITVNNSSLYAATGGGVYQSSIDNSNNWQSINKGISGNIITSLLDKGNGSLYAGTLAGGIFKSTDNGSSWTDISNGISANSSDQVSEIVNDNNDFLYALLIDKSSMFSPPDDLIYKFNKNNKKWVQLKLPLDPSSNTSVIPSFIFADDKVLYLGTFGNGLYQSKDGGSDWKLFGSTIYSPLDGMTIINSTNQLYVTITGDILSTSANGNSNWVSIGENLPTSLTINQILVENNSLYAATNQGLYVTNNGGQTWNALNNGLPYFSNITNLSIHGNLFIASIESSGIFLSFDGGQNWISANNGMNPNDYVTNITQNNAFIFASTINNLQSLPTPWEPSLYRAIEQVFSANS